MNIKESLSIFGLDPKEQDVYLMLTKTGPITALVLSRKCGIKRSSLYRVLERMEEKGLIEVKVDDKTTFYSAVSPKQFETIVSDQEEKAKCLKEAMKPLQSMLMMMGTTNQRDTVVKIHRGEQGLKYLEWKKTEIPHKEILIMGSGDSWWKTVGREFAESIRSECVEKDIHIRELVNDGNAEIIPKNGSVTWTENRNYVLQHLRHRVIDNNAVKFTQDIYILPSEIHFHGYNDGDILGIELINTDYATMMKQIYEILWKQAKVIDNFG